VIVALDTSSTMCSVAVMRRLDDGSHRVLAVRNELSGATQTRVLLGLVDQTLAEVGTTPEHVSALFVGTGPGTFTGVRIGVATARSLALALDVPVFGRCSLHALAAAALTRGRVSAEDTAVVPVVDARRGQVFAAVFVRAERLRADRDQATAGVDETTGVEETEGPVLFDVDGFPWVRLGDVYAADPSGVAESVDRLIGTGAGVGLGAGAGPVYLGRTDLLSEVLGRREPGEIEAAFLVVGHAAVLPDFAAFRGARPGDPGTPESVAPIYVRSPDADVHIAKMRDPWA